jgi:hypothetical protein
MVSDTPASASQAEKPPRKDDAPDPLPQQQFGEIGNYK